MRALRNIMLVVLILLGTVGYGQTGRIAPMGGPNVNAKALGMLSADSLVCAAGDTIGAGYTARTGFSRKGGLAVVGGIFMYFDGAAWVTPATGGAGSVTTAQLADSMRLVVHIKDSGVAYVTPYDFDSTYTYLLGVTAYLADAIDSTGAALQTAIDGKQDTLGYVAEDVGNKVTDLNSPDNTTYPTTLATLNGDNTVAQNAQAALDDTSANLRAVFAADLADSMQAVRDSLLAIRGDIPDVSGLAYQEGLDDTAAAIRAVIPDVTGFATQQGLDDTAAAHLALINGKQPAGNYITALTGDVTAAGPGSTAATLANSGVTAGTYGSSLVHLQVTVDAKGRVTSITTVNPMTRPNSDSLVSSATPTINTDNVNCFKLTAQAVNITSMTTNLSGTPRVGQSLLIIIKHTGSITIAWGAAFANSTINLPTSYTGAGTHYVVVVWDGSGTWVCSGSW